MKDNWERTEETISLDLTDIEDIIKQAFPDKKLISAERIGIGLSNSNYKILMEGSEVPYVFRLYRGGRDVADKELAIAKLVRQTVPVADFIYVDTTFTRAQHPWALMEWKEGILLGDVLKKGTQADIVSAATSVGRNLAQIHSYTFSESGFFDEDLNIKEPITMDGKHFLSFIRQSLFHQPCGTWLGADLTQAVWSFCQTYSPLFSDNSESPVLVHSDFNGLNILVRDDLADGSVSAVLDWEFAFSWNRYVDIGNMLRYEEDGSLFEKHFIRAYLEEGGLLDKNWKILSKLEDLVALCDMLNHSTLNTPRRMKDLRHLVERTIQTS
ncbi:aminoglycoside phosphotransferase family protein [Paenibacillus sp. Marseille-Q4541]|uniref:phosphotransferase family protein n=1 Tax=Paenibacillus sp. Marseille-Q4541 TaxID=2831522 RepID=UPI001BA8B078|nr:aminoglycoside phosphotransferase family protein [Paenibacillus sp. Marseille-Q4541]